MIKPSIFYFKNLWFKIRYSHFLRLFSDALDRIGIRIAPYYLFREAICPNHPPERPDGFEDYKMDFWGAEEIKAMAEIPGRPFSEDFLLQRLNHGNLCLGLKKNNRLVAFTWCDLTKTPFKYHRFPLKENDAYMFDAYTMVDYRGKGIAPFLRYHLYKELQKLGRTGLYSFSNYFNTSAVRFKLKLEAKKVKLVLGIGLFGKWHFSFLLKDYQNYPPHNAAD